MCGDRLGLSRPFEIVGDVHGCGLELELVSVPAGRLHAESAAYEPLRSATGR